MCRPSGWYTYQSRDRGGAVNMPMGAGAVDGEGADGPGNAPAKPCTGVDGSVIADGGTESGRGGMGVRGGEGRMGVLMVS